MAIVAQNSKYGKTGRTILAWAVGLLFFFPIFWLVLTSFKTDADAVKPEYLIWFTPTLENYTNMTENYDYCVSRPTRSSPRSLPRSLLWLWAFPAPTPWPSTQHAPPRTC